MGKPRLRETTCSATVEPQLSREIIPVCGTIKHLYWKSSRSSILSLSQSLNLVSHWEQKRKIKIHTAHQTPTEFIQWDVATEFWKYLLIPKMLIPLRGHEALCQASQNDVSLWLAATSNFIVKFPVGFHSVCLSFPDGAKYVGCFLLQI